MHRTNTANITLTADQPPANAVWLSSLDLSAVQKYYSPRHDGGVENEEPAVLRGVEYPHALYAHANSVMSIDLEGAAEAFHAVVGVRDDSTPFAEVSFEAWVDGRLAVQTPDITATGELVQLSVDLRGAKTLDLVTDGFINRIRTRDAVWAGALLVLKSGAKPALQMCEVGEDPQPIAMGAAVEPSINHPRVTGATPGRPFLFRVPTSGQGPLTFEAVGLPPGLKLDAETGIITGALEQIGEWYVRITVTSPHGKDSNTLKIVGGWRKLALTPPMGWNAWNAFAQHVTDEGVRAAARAMVDSGLAAHGYQYVNIDDFWMGERDADGWIQSRETFPDMQGLADYIHSLGLKAGLYSSPGPETCGGCLGSFNHELQDAQKYAEWGYDFLKHDMCSYEKRIIHHDSRGEQQRPYLVMRAALDSVDRDIIYSLCQYGWAGVEEWGSQIGANLWRTTSDISDEWGRVADIGFEQAGLEDHAGPGHWNDPDMLVVGMVGWETGPRPNKLTRNEQISHVTLWSLLAAPLLVGCDLTQLDDFTVALLTNDEVIGVNQDPLGKQARRVVLAPRAQIWARPLADGATAVGLFNRSHRPARVSVTWEQLGLSGKLNVRSLWTHEDLGAYENEFAADIPRHGALLLKLTK